MADSRSVFLCFPLLNNNIQLDYQEKMVSKQYLNFFISVILGMREEGMVKNFRNESQDLWITSKVWNDLHHDVIGFCEKSLTDLQLERNKPIYQYVPTITEQNYFIKDYASTFD